MFENLLNLKDYEPVGLITFGIGCVVWGIVYAFVIRDVIKYKTVGIPVAAIMANFAWEINWGLIYHTDMGKLYVWLYFMWFFLDCVIVFFTLKYGMKQAITSDGKKYFLPAAIGYFIFWFVFFFNFIKEYDDAFGGLTGYMVNVHMSILFLADKLRRPAFGTSRAIAISKTIGTLLCVFVCFIRYPSHETLHSLNIMFFIIDIIYIYLVFKGPKYNALAEATLSS